ncbi:MAG: hypothetical protein AAF799_45720 [Myxococcota bacterium]
MQTQSTRKIGESGLGGSQGEMREVEVEFRHAHDLMRLAWNKGKSHFPCTTARDRSLKGGTIVHPESFTAMVVADLLMGQRGEQSVLVRQVVTMLEWELGKDEDVFYFFKKHERLPADADCTALGLSVMLLGGARVEERAHRALDRILANCDQNGVVETYFDPTGERDGIVDPVVCANVLFLAHQLGRGDEARATLEHVHQVLLEESYLEGSRYYHSPDTFLYFLGRVVHHFPETQELLLEPLRHAVQKRLGISTDTIDVAQRTLLCTWFDIDDHGEFNRLVAMQEADGCWPNDALFRYGRKKVYFGSRVMTTAFAVTAVMQGQDGRVSQSEPEQVEGEVVISGENVHFVEFGKG